MCSQRKPQIEPMIIWKAKFFFDKMKITWEVHICWLQSNKKLSVGNLVSIGTDW